jgi:glycosyltransferase involved in cell wall biosynthesis
MSQRILFFVNNLNRTGSETLILNLINDLNQQNNLEIGIVLFKRGGELVPEIASNIPVFYLDLGFSSFDKLKFHSGIDVIGNKLAKIQLQFAATMWYFNTIDYVSLLKYKTRFNCKAFVHVHEMIGRFDSFNKDELYSVIDHCDHLIACSSLIKDLFETFFPKPITVINSTIDFEMIGKFKKNKTFNPREKVTVLTSGTISYNKGADIFHEVAKILSNNNFEFIWLGKPNQTAFSEIVRLKNQQNPVIQFITTHSDQEYLEIFSQADVFLSTSREESMGLVLMEAIALEIPVLATNSGGSTLIVDEQVGDICQDLRPEMIAKQLLEMVEHLDKFSFSGEPKFHYSVELEKLIQIVH